ncbi:MAG: DUF4230 domain-containing protein [Eubacterium sp.]|nr:DUF4230 domain-containing protein [Eubacterium sp.]
MNGGDGKTVVKVKSSHRLWIILIILVMIVSFAAGFFIGQSLNKTEVSEGMVTEQLKECSELTTTISTMTGSIKVKEGAIPFINQKKYTMKYVANVRAGIDLKKVKTSIDGKTIKVSVPHSKILDISFPEKGIEFYNSMGSIFNWRSQEDAKTGLKEARKKVEKHIKEKDSKILIKADKQVVNTIDKLLTFAKEEGYSVETSFIE